MPLHRDSAHRVTQLLRQASAVAALDPSIETLRERLAEFERTAGQHRIIDLLASSVADGNPDPLMFTAAFVELTGTPQVAAEVIAQVKQRIHRRIRDIAAESGQTMYRQAGQKFTGAAERFLTTYNTTDVEVPAEVAVSLPDKARRAWQAAPELAAELDKMAPSLHACAVLAGMVTDDLAGEIQVCVDASDCDPEAIKAAWTTRETEARQARQAANASPHTGRAVPTVTRGGRWSSLIQCGATIRVYDPDDFRLMEDAMSVQA